MLERLYKRYRNWAARKGGPGPLMPDISLREAQRPRLVQACLWGGHASPPRHISRRWPNIAPFFLALLALSGPLAAAPPGAPIDNRAALNFQNGAGVDAVVFSNDVQLITAVIRTSAEIELTRVVAAGERSEVVGPAYCSSGGSLSLLPNPVVPGLGEVDPTVAQQVSASSSFNLGEPLFLRLEDSDQNVDYLVIDTVSVRIANLDNGDSETIQLSETGPNTGVFAGYLPSASGAPTGSDCVLQGAMGDAVEVIYEDPADAGDTALASALLDPVGRIFDSQTGIPVSGATVRLLDARTGRPALVFGNDAVSTFPAEIVSGASVTDSGGTVYTFADGEYRFPSVAPGEYQLEVEPPDDFAGPSTVSEQDLQLLPNAPYRLGPASFDLSFVHDGNGPFTFDYPVDPLSSTLFLQKSTTTTLAAPGDFVRYELRLENTSESDAARSAVIVDQLPAGTRYVAGSTSIDGAEAGNPSIDASGAELTFTLGDLDAGATSVVSYVLEIVAGASGDDLVNAAFARADGGILSNQTQARIRLAEDLFRSTSTLVGRVLAGSCEAATFAEDQGVAGVRVYLEDGRYAVSDEGGRFHFEGLTPGGHVAQLDPESVPDYFEIVGCDAQGRFAGRPDAQFVDLSRGSLQRADFYLRRKLPPEGSVNISLDSFGGPSSEDVNYELAVRGIGNIAVADVNAQVLLPDGMRFARGSLQVDGDSVSPRVMGQSITIPLPSGQGSWQRRITFSAEIAPEVAGELKTRAVVRFDSPSEENQQTPVAETVLQREAATWENAGYVLNLNFASLSADLSADGRRQLDDLIDSWRGVQDIRIIATGHSDSTRIASRNRHLFADNYALSRARANAAASYLAEALGVADEGVQVEGRGPDDPVASNESTEGREQNRRVELILGGQRPGKKSFLKVAQASSGAVVTATRGLPPGVAEAARQMLDDQALADHLAPPQEVEAHINSLTPGAGWVLPEVEFQPAIPAIRIAIKHGRDQTVALFVNGLEVNPLNYDGTANNTERTVAVSRWTGVDLLEGTNQLVADIIGANGRVVDRITREVHYAGPPARAELVTEMSRLVADGKTRPVIAVRLFDRFGKPARHSTVGAFSIDAPYRSWWAVQSDRENKLVHIGNREPIYTVGDDGVAYIELEPTTQSGAATVRLQLDNQREQEFSVWLKPQPRDWIMVGFGEGTVGYNTLSKNSEAAIRAGEEDGYYDEGRVAFFAKGQIKGEYLLTLAYDSARERDEARQRFQTEVNPNQYYTLYGDNTEQRFEAPSQRKLYVKLERNQFLAMFGDYSTGLSTTELARYERRFNGLKSEYHGEHVGYTAFAADTDQTFVRDEIAGDGTSGLYRLSAAPLIVNSETIRLEVRDRFDPAVVLSSQSLTRFLDYNLDPFDGSIFFKKPVPSRDAEFNPILIVAEYETSGGSEENIVAGGRVAVYSSDKNLELGVTHISEDRDSEQGELSAVDLRWRVTEGTEVRAEFAESEDSAVDPDSGSAQLVSVQHRSEKLDLRASYREIDQSFGLGQQATAERGIRKYALESRYLLTPELSLQAQAALQENLETGTERTLADADLEYQGDKTTASLGVTHAEDRFWDGETRTSNIVDAGVSRRLFDSALTARATGSIGIGNEPENTDYLSSYVVGFDYAILEQADLFVEYENAEGRDIETEMTRVGVRATPWQRAQINSSLTNEMTEFGPRLFANLGLVQGFQLTENWIFDVGLDQTETLRGSSERTFDTERPPAFGSFNDDYVAGYVGTLYQSERWSVNTRLEYRDADMEKRASFVSGWYREPSLGHGMSAGLTVYNSNRSDNTDALAAELRFGWAYRPADSRWALLNRVDLEYEDLETATGGEQTWRLINNLNANRRIGAASQLGLQYAFKYVRSDFQTTDVTGYTDLIGVDYSHGFGNRWEVGFHTSIYHSYRSEIFDYGAGVDIGFNLATDMWVSLGYNFTGFHDADFASARYTAQGPYLTLTVRGHQELLRRITGR